jgi:hypothetical protein
MGRNTEERDGDKGMKGIMGRKKESEGLKYRINCSLLIHFLCSTA